MKSALFKLSVFAAGAFPLLIGMDAMALPGPPPAVPRPPAGGPPRIPSGGPPRAGAFNRPSAPGGGFRGGGVPRPQIPSRAPNISRPGPGRSGGLAPNSKLAGAGHGPHTASRAPNASRPVPGQSGGLAPNGNLAGTRPGPQFPSKIQSFAKGSGSVLPSFASGAALGSIAQGHPLGAGPAGKGFPDLSGRGPDELLNKAPEPLANQEVWKNWSQQNQGQLVDFQENRAQDWTNINAFRNNQNVAGSFNQPEWNDYKNNVQNYHDNRAIEVTNNIQNSFDNNFNSDWWKDHGGDYADKYASYADKYGSYAEKYWWWGAATYTTAATWLALDRASGNSGSYDYGSGSYDSGNSGSYDYGNSQSHDSGRSRSYDYGVNVAYEGDNVYVDGKRVASAKEYSQQAITLANTSGEQPPAPMPPEDGKQANYLPLGVWAMAQEQKGDANMFFQISIDKDGVVTGAFRNLLSGEASPISGQVDKETQRVAWKIGSNNTVIEAGLQNLTENVASCLVHFGTDTTQTWLLVRLKQPEIPTTPSSEPVADDSK